MLSSLRSGLVSVTFRQRSVAQIVADVAKAGLQAIEWGGDVHVPPGNLTVATDARRRTVDAGLAVSSYGSYYNATKDPADVAERVLATATELGAPTVRIWAGPMASAAATDADYARVAEDVVRVADLAKPLGVSVTLEYHGGTLTDTLPSTLKLLNRVNHPNVLSGWQPRDGITAAAGVEEIRQIGDKLSTVHVFQWRSWTDRQPLAEGAERWKPFLAAAAADAKPRFALLEFVVNDDIDQFFKDAETLKRLLA